MVTSMKRTWRRQIGSKILLKRRRIGVPLLQERKARKGKAREKKAGSSFLKRSSNEMKTHFAGSAVFWLMTYEDLGC